MAVPRDLCEKAVVKARQLGKTGLRVSELGLGTWGLCGGGYGAVPEDVAETVIRRALDIGMTFIDTADAYGAGGAESMIGRVLKDEPAGKDAIVATKVGTDRTTVPALRRFDGAWLRARVEASLKRLGREALDICLLHNPSDEGLREGDAPDVMLALKKEGKIRHWGVAAGDQETAQAAIERGAEVVELAYNILHAAELHRLAGDIVVGGTGILARSVLGYGLLAGLWPKNQTFAEDDHRRERWTTADFERRHGQLDAIRFLVHGDVHTLRGAAVRYVLSNHIVSSAVLGPRSVVQLEQLVRETGSGPTYLPDADLAALPRALQKVGVLV